MKFIKNILNDSMAYIYSKRNVISSKLLEIVSFILYRIFSLLKLKNKDRYEIDNILIIEPFQMGDVISLSVMIEPLKKKFPQSSVFILTQRKNKDVFEFDKSISVITSEFPWSDYEKNWNLKRYIRLLKDIISYRKLKISIGIDPRGDVRSQAILLSLGCRQRIGYTNYVNSNVNIKGLLLTNKARRPSSEHRYDWNANLLFSLGIENVFPLNFPTIKINSSNNDHEKNKKLVLIHPGAGWVYRQWPLNNWARLIKRIYEDLNIRVCVIGGENEKNILNKIKNLINNSKIEFKITDYKELINYIKAADLFLCLDSGPMNLAVCMHKSVIALFGPGDSTIWKPYTSKSYYIHKKESFPCNPCFQKFCYYPEKNCMAAISVDEVMDIVNIALKS